MVQLLKTSYCFIGTLLHDKRSLLVQPHFPSISVVHVCLILLTPSIHMVHTRILDTIPLIMYRVSKKDCTIFLFFFLGAQCVESGVSCTDCY
jgi:hypothetical protein